MGTDLLLCRNTWTGLCLSTCLLRLGAGWWWGEVGLRETVLEGCQRRWWWWQQSAVGAVDVTLTHKGQVSVGVLFHCAEAWSGVWGSSDRGQVGAKGWVAWRGQQAPPGWVSVGTGAEGGVQAFWTEAGGEGPPLVDAVFSALLEGGGSGTGQVRGDWAGGRRRSQPKEVRKHQVVFVQESTLVVSSCALSPA